MALGYSGYQGYDSPDAVKRRREIEAALMGRALSNAPQNVGEGLTAIGQALAIRRMRNADAKAEAAGQASASAAFNPIVAALSGGGASPETVSASPQPTAGDYADARVKTASGDSAASIKQGLIDRGMSPQIADAFVMNFQDESGLNPGINEAAPIVPGSRGGYGLAQWTGPRRRALEAYAAQQGKPVSDTGTQLDFLMSELNGPEKAAWTKIQGADTTGGAAAAIVNSFLRPAESHRAAREGRYLANTDPMQVASLDPAAGMAQPPAPPLPPPRTISNPQVAQVGPDLASLPVEAGGNGGALSPQQAAQAGPFPNAPGGKQNIMQALLQASSNPWLNDSQRSIVRALLGQELKKQDPAYALDTEYKRAQIDALNGKQSNEPDSVRALRIRAEAAGLQPGTKEYNDFMISGGGKGVNVNVDTGTIPQGYQAVRDENGRVTRYEPIPGGPADTSAADAQKEQNRATSTDVVTGAADKIRGLSKEFGTTGMAGAAASYAPWTDAAEVYRQVDVLKSNATIENLNAMRRESKTGGALGNVTEGEGKMLSAKAGALDPKSPHFQEQLDDYERTLLRTIHGKEAGDAIFEQTRRGAKKADKPVSEMSDQELEAIINGQ